MGKFSPMPNPRHAQRLPVLEAAKRGGWEIRSEQFDGGDILRDVFIGDRGVIRVVWLRTPWSDDGRYAGAILSDKRSGTDRNVWKVSGSDGLIALLQAGAADVKPVR